MRRDSGSYSNLTVSCSCSCSSHGQEIRYPASVLEYVIGRLQLHATGICCAMPASGGAKIYEPAVTIARAKMVGRRMRVSRGALKPNVINEDTCYLPVCLINISFDSECAFRGCRFLVYLEFLSCYSSPGVATQHIRQGWQLQDLQIYKTSLLPPLYLHLRSKGYLSAHNRKANYKHWVFSLPWGTEFQDA